MSKDLGWPIDIATTVTPLVGQRVSAHNLKAPCILAMVILRYINNPGLFYNPQTTQKYTETTQK